jgi:hypothetical protein
MDTGSGSRSGRRRLRCRTEVLDQKVRRSAVAGVLPDNPLVVGDKVVDLGLEAPYEKEHDRSDAEAKRERQDRQPPFALFISSLGLPFYRLVVGLTPHVATPPPSP